MGSNSELYERVTGFLAPNSLDDYLHSGTSGDYTLSETSYVGFNIPEAAIDAQIYHWFHPELGIVSGGIIIWQGLRETSADADYIDYRNFMPYPSGSVTVQQYPTGVRVEVLEPMKRLKVSFESPDGRTRLEMISEAVMPPAGRADGKHFAQAMRNRGELVLNGVSHRIDGHFTRDRSYDAPRAEIQRPIPPMTWGAAVFGDDLALHFVGFDAPEQSEDAIQWGYVWDGNSLATPVSMQKVTTREADGVTPDGAELEIVDDRGRTFSMKATMLARLPMSFWPNMITNLILMRYELPDGRVGYGDYQDIVFNTFLREARVK